MPKKETSARISIIAAKLLGQPRPKEVPEELWEQIQSVAASALSQDETPADALLEAEWEAAHEMAKPGE